jgi:uncharacterized protein with von Willebrand factor type A (vWA) domain
MERMIVEFVRLLRRHRLRVSPAEGLDALEALRRTGLADRDVVRDALRATLIKRAEDVAAFDRLFDLYFGLGEDVRSRPAASAPHIHDNGASPTELRFGEDLESDPMSEEEHSHDPPSATDLRRFLDDDQLRPGSDFHGEPERLRLSVFGSQLMLSRSQDALEQAMKRMTHQLRVRRARSFSPGSVAPETGAERLPVDITDAEFADLVDELRETGVDEGLIQAITANADDILAALPELLQSLMERQERMNAAAARQMPAASLSLRRMLELSPGDERELEAAIKRLGRQLHGAKTRRMRRARTGRVDVAQTLRANLGYEGVPFEPVLRRRREQRPRLVVLLDVSLSTRNLARFWLQLVFELQSHFSRVRTFAFVADLVEITQLLEEQGLARGVETLFAGGLLDVDENSDFGRAAEQMRTGHLGAINRRTTVVVLGDGRNNGRPPNVGALEEIARHARRVLWMTPEPRWGWQLGSCDMPHYEPVCDAVEVVRTAADLGTFAERLLQFQGSAERVVQ